MRSLQDQIRDSLIFAAQGEFNLQSEAAREALLQDIVKKIEKFFVITLGELNSDLD